jgi:hypothetical protein
METSQASFGGSYRPAVKPTLVHKQAPKFGGGGALREPLFEHPIWGGTTGHESHLKGLGDFALFSLAMRSLKALFTPRGPKKPTPMEVLEKIEKNTSHQATQANLIIPKS